MTTEPRLTVRRKADRQRMAEQVVVLAAKHGFAARQAVNGYMLTDDELAWLRYAALMFARDRDVKPTERVLTCLAKLNHNGTPPLEDLRRHLPPRWYVSQTGRKLKSRDVDETPITPRRYAAAERAALADAGRRILHDPVTKAA